MTDGNRDAAIRIDRIPVRGGIGAAILILMLLGGMVLDVPGLRIPAIVGIAGGLVWAAVLFAWHRRN